MTPIEVFELINRLDDVTDKLIQVGRAMHLHSGMHTVYWDTLEKLNNIKLDMVKAAIEDVKTTDPHH